MQYSVRYKIQVVVEEEEEEDEEDDDEEEEEEEEAMVGSHRFSSRGRRASYFASLDDPCCA